VLRRAPVKGVGTDIGASTVDGAELLQAEAARLESELENLQAEETARVAAREYAAAEAVVGKQRETEALLVSLRRAAEETEVQARVRANPVYGRGVCLGL